MTTTIHKFALNEGRDTNTKVPFEHRFLKIMEQNGAPALWAEVDPKTPMIDVTIQCVGTGHEMEQDFTRVYIDSVIMGAFVWHFFAKYGSHTGRRA